MGHCLNEGPGEIELRVKMRVTRSRTKRPRGALLQLGIELGLSLCRIAGRLRSWGASLGGVTVEIPAWSSFGPNGWPCSGTRTVPGGQFDWGGRLLKGNGGAQRFPQAEWKPAKECKGIRELDCESYKTSRDESRA